MTLLSVVQAVSEVVGVESPVSVFANISATRTMQEMLALANEMAQRIAYDARDWTLFRKVATCTGDDVTTAFPLPADFKRMLLTTNVWRSTSALTPMEFIPDTDKWLNHISRNIYSPFGEWTMMGGNINFTPALATGQTATFAYLEKNCITNSSGNTDAFTSDTDTFRLDERLLKLGMIWQWKAQKGATYAEDMGTYGDALAYAMGHDQPAPIIIGRQPLSAAMRINDPFSIIGVGP